MLQYSMSLYYFTKTSFFTSTKLSASNLEKYTPLGNPSAFHCRVYLPASNFPEKIVATSLPMASNIFSFTKYSDGRLKEIVVDGLNGFG